MPIHWIVRVVVLVVAFAFSVLAQESAALAAPEQTTGPIVSISGAVLDSSNLQPIEGARVILNRSDRGRPNVSSSIWQTELNPADPDPVSDTLAVLTGSDGMFRFQIDSPARFRLFVDHEGYVSTPTGGDPRAFAFEIGTGEAKDDIVISLQPEGSISGQVTDIQTGQPAPWLLVLPFYMGEARASRLPWPVGSSATTDSEGRYEITGLAPGEYYLQLIPRGGAELAAPGATEDFGEVEYSSYTPSWYPGVDVFEQSPPLFVGSRARLEGVDFRITKRATAGIRGSIVGDEDAGPVAVSLTRIERQNGSVGYRNIAQGERMVGSEFEIGNLYPGKYWLMAETSEEDARQNLFASIMFDIVDRNLDGVDLHMRPGLTVSGRMRIAGREADPDQPALPDEGTRVALRPVSRGNLKSDGPAGVHSGDGSFVFEGVVPGELLVLVIPEPQGYKVAEVRYNNLLIAEHVITVEPGTVENRLEITLAPANGSLSVVVTDGFDPAAGATVLVVPKAVDTNVDPEVLIRVFLAQATTDEEGLATVGSLLPGVYRAIAFRQGEFWMNEIDRIFTSGQEVRVAGTGPTISQLRVEE